jgi:methyltransferase (TIGR00027 family)
MLDAQGENPVCGDNFAERFMNDEGLKFLESFKDEAEPNASNVARHRVIDDLLRAELAAHPDLRVVTIGAGFDSRPYRLDGGTWVELDEPQVILYKNERLPVTECNNELHRVAIDFSEGSLEEKLAPFAGNGGPVVVIFEGVFVYVEEDAIGQTLQALRNVFPQHKLICDLTSRKFFDKYSSSMSKKLTGIGGSFKFTVDQPERIFVESGYKLTDKISVVGSAVKYGSIKMPSILLKTFFRTLADGYSIYVFEAR